MDFIKFDKNVENTDVLQKIATFKYLKHVEIYSDHAPDPVEFHMRRMKAPVRPTHSFHYYLVQDKDDIGYFEIRLNRITDRHHMGVDIWVAPENRGKGYFRKILAHILSLAPEYVTDLTPGFTLRKKEELIENSFQHWVEQTFDVKVVYNERINIMELSNYDLEDVKSQTARMMEETKSKGFDLYFVENGKFNEVPEIDYESHLNMVGRIWNDMPSEDADWEDEVISDEIYQAYFSDIQSSNGFVWTLVAVHKESNEPAGLTDVYVYKDNPLLVRQADTGVDRKFRGNGLGLALKYVMLERILSDPQVKQAKWWSTANAHSNTHMLRINDQMGYIHEYSMQWYEIPVDRLTSYLER